MSKQVQVLSVLLVIFTAILPVYPQSSSMNGVANQTIALADYGGQVFNVKAYGALGNGSTDDSTAIQAAITAAAAAGTSTQAAQVYFPHSTANYEVCGATQISLASNVYLVGERGTTIQACSSLVVSANIIQTSNWSTAKGTTSYPATGPSNFGMFGIRIDGNTAGRGTMSYFVTNPLTPQSASASMSTSTASFAPSTGSFSVTGLAAGMLLSVENCSVSGYNQVTWTITTVSTTSITATSNPSGTSGLSSATGCQIRNDFQGLNLGIHGYEYEMYDNQFINSPNVGVYSEFGKISSTSLRSTWRLNHMNANTNVGRVYAGPTDSMFIEDRAFSNGYEGKIFKQVLYTSSTVFNSAWGFHLIGTHDFHNGLSGTPGYGDEIDIFGWIADSESENNQTAGGFWLTGNGSGCGALSGTQLSVLDNTGDGVTFSPCSNASYPQSFVMTDCTITANTVYGLDFNALTAFANINIGNCNPTGDTTDDIAWPSSAVTASNSSFNGQYGTATGTVPSGMGFLAVNLNSRVTSLFTSTAGSTVAVTGLGFTLPNVASAISYGYSCQGTWNEAATQGAIQWYINNSAAVTDFNINANFVTPTSGAPGSPNFQANHQASLSANTNSTLSNSTITPTGNGQSPFWISGSVLNPASTSNVISIQVNTPTSDGAVHVYEGSECHAWQETD